MPRVLLCGPDPRLSGGVVSAIEAIRPHLPQAERVVTGRRPGWPLAALGDPARLAAWRGRADLVHLNPSLRPRALARDLAVLAAWGGPAVAWVHGGTDATWDRLVRWRLGRLVGDRLTVVALAPRFAERLRAAGLGDARVRVLPPPIDPQRVPPTGDPDGHVLFLGRLTADKGADLLLEAFARGGGRRRLVLAGPGPLREALGRRAVALGVADRVQLPGALGRSAVRAAVARAAVLVLPSRDEAYPVSVLEALAAGVPVVATRVGALPDLDPPGRLVDGTVDAVAAGLEAVLGDPAATARARAEAPAVRARHDPAAIAAALSAIWDEAVRS